MPEFGFIGRGWHFPPTFRRGTCGVDMLVEKTEIENSFEVLFSTAPGERVMQPDFGLNMRRLIFEPLNPTLQAIMQDQIRNAIRDYEPRVRIEFIRLEAAPEEGLVRILLSYTIAGTNSRQNFVFPFYTGEGSEITSP